MAERVAKFIRNRDLFIPGRGILSPLPLHDIPHFLDKAKPKKHREFNKPKLPIFSPYAEKNAVEVQIARNGDRNMNEEKRNQVTSILGQYKVAAFPEPHNTSPFRHDIENLTELNWLSYLHNRGDIHTGTFSERHLAQKDILSNKGGITLTEMLYEFGAETLGVEFDSKTIKAYKKFREKRKPTGKFDSRDGSDQLNSAITSQIKTALGKKEGKEDTKVKRTVVLFAHDTKYFSQHEDTSPLGTMHHSFHAFVENLVNTNLIARYNIDTTQKQFQI